ncbi:hypothetical protein Glove_186g32 [Diversispora epigaea]|uniref:Uncharacterized protein n=1 Tax=Diversispora epigaea TaxID=1348612 RepID=A0A397IPW4_9GLOM|nr:hypothetical protein Glove_186g32 [Diversispora epigaea]
MSVGVMDFGIQGARESGIVPTRGKSKGNFVGDPWIGWIGTRIYLLPECLSVLKYFGSKRQETMADNMLRKRKCREGTTFYWIGIDGHKVKNKLNEGYSNVNIFYNSKGVDPCVPAETNDYHKDKEWSNEALLLFVNGDGVMVHLHNDQ